MKLLRGWAQSAYDYSDKEVKRRNVTVFAQTQDSLSYLLHCYYFRKVERQQVR
jgi:hypothetical protein